MAAPISTRASCASRCRTTACCRRPTATATCKCSQMSRWSRSAARGHLPMHGSDFGLFQLAEVLGMKQVIYVKDEDGLYDKDPKRHADAKQFGKNTLDELMPQLPDDNILDRELFHAWSHAKNLTRIAIVNGLKPGQLTRAIRGEDVGTVIVKEPRE